MMTNNQNLRWNLALLLGDRLTIEQRQSIVAYDKKVAAWSEFRAQVEIENASTFDQVKRREEILDAI